MIALSPPSAEVAELVSDLQEALVHRDPEEGITAVLTVLDRWFLTNGDVSASRAAMMLTQHHLAEPDEAPMLTVADAVAALEDHKDREVADEIKRRYSDGTAPLLAMFLTDAQGKLAPAMLRRVLDDIMDTEEDWTAIEDVVREVAHEKYLHHERGDDEDDG